MRGKKNPTKEKKNTQSKTKEKEKKEKKKNAVFEKSNRGHGAKPAAGSPPLLLPSFLLSRCCDVISNAESKIEKKKTHKQGERKKKGKQKEKKENRASVENPHSRCSALSPTNIQICALLCRRNSCDVSALKERRCANLRCAATRTLGTSGVRAGTRGAAWCP